jgi:hypothetical protein
MNCKIIQRFQREGKMNVNVLMYIRVPFVSLGRSFAIFLKATLAPPFMLFYIINLWL